MTDAFTTSDVHPSSQMNHNIYTNQRICPIRMGVDITNYFNRSPGQYARNLSIIRSMANRKAQLHFRKLTT
jgi:hypothetical protein